MLTCPPGFDFEATAAVLRRGAADPLIWFDGRRWRRHLAVNGSAFLLEVNPTSNRRGVPIVAQRGGPNAGLSARILAGCAPRPLLERTVARLFGLDDPARSFVRHLPDALRHVRRTLPGTSLPGYPTLFEALVHTILGQQISAPAANVHRAAFTKRFGRPFTFRATTYWTFPATAAVAGERLASLRRPGLTTAKAVAVRGIARAIERGAISEAVLEEMSPEAAIEALTALPGIGRWTAEWVLLRALRRFEIVPAGDLAIRKAVSWFAGRLDLLSEVHVRDLVSPWGPYAGLIAFRLLLAHRQAIA